VVDMACMQYMKCVASKFRSMRTNSANVHVGLIA
jgi:hypothetical protein